MNRTEALSLLELGNTATRDEITRRALKLLTEFHPDKHAEATGNVTFKKLLEEKFNKVREARDCLLNSTGEIGTPAQSPPATSETTVDPSEAAVVLCGIIGEAVKNGDWTAVAEGAVRLAAFPGHEQLARRLLAGASIQLGNFGIAAEAALAATNFDTKDDEAWFLLALVHSKQERWHEASTAIRKAIRHSRSAEKQYEDLRDAVDRALVSAKPLGENVGAFLEGKCPVCGSKKGFKGGRCQKCKYESTARAWAEKASAAVGRFLNADNESDTTPQQETQSSGEPAGCLFWLACVFWLLVLGAFLLFVVAPNFKFR